MKSVTDLNTKLSEIEKPNRATEHLNNLSILISRANDRIQKSATASVQVRDSIIPQIELEVADFHDKVNYEFEGLGINELLSIPHQLLVLDSINNEIHQLELKRIKIIDKGVTKDISKMISSLSVDSVFIIKELRTILNEPIDSLEFPKNSDRYKEESRSFFQKLFGRRSETDKSNHGNSGPESQRDERSTGEQKQQVITTSEDTVIFQQTAESDSIFLEMVILINQISEDVKEINYQIIHLKERRFDIQNEMIFGFEKLSNRYNELLERQYLSKQQELSSEIRGFIKNSFLYFSGFALMGLIGFFSIYHSIQANKRFQQQLKENERLANELASQRLDFLHMMSHELRTPLTSIIGYIDQMDERNENVKSVKLASNYLFHLISNVLDVAKLNSKGLELVEKPFGIQQLVKEAEETLKPLIVSKGLRAEFSCQSEEIFVVADYHRLQQMLYNLINNAVKFTEKGTIALKVNEMKVGASDYVDVVFEVSDTGIGISEDDLNLIFEDFAQVGERANKVAGTGLGLGLVKRLTQIMNGKIQVSSTVGEGTTFALHFSFERAERAAVTVAIRDSFASNFLQGKNILVLDDDKLIANLYRRILEKYGATISVYFNPLEAFDHLKANLRNYDLLFFDFKMPNMNGFELWDALGFSTMANRPPVILSTANVLQSKEDLAQMKVFDTIIKKPIKEAEVLSKVSEVLNLDVGEIEKVEISKGKLFDFSQLSLFAGNDEDELLTLIKMMHDENAQELPKLKSALAEGNITEVKMIIHKLSSRFAQIGVELPTQLNHLENVKNMEEDELSLDQANELLEFWCSVNDKLGNVNQSNV